jgi:ADP-ribose pyrophosphatase YjhB (NUDIX family)
MNVYIYVQVGVGGVVVNSKRQVLMMKEKGGTSKGHWKFPGGLTNPGESLQQGAEREVWEETGIRSQFQGVLFFRQQHNMAFGVSDL